MTFIVRDPPSLSEDDSIQFESDGDPDDSPVPEAPSSAEVMVNTTTNQNVGSSTPIVSENSMAVEAPARARTVADLLGASGHHRRVRPRLEAPMDAEDAVEHQGGIDWGNITKADAAKFWSNCNRQPTAFST